MAELADAADLGSAEETRGGSSPSGRTNEILVLSGKNRTIDLVL